jgi:hypothetical protein
MPEQVHDLNSLKTANRKKIRISIAIAVVGSLSVVCYLLFTHQNTEEQLAAIAAARAIPDSKNAAIIYNEVLVQNTEAQLRPDFLDYNAYYSIISRPWTSREYPKLAEWIERHTSTIGKLRRAAELDMCRFSLGDETLHSEEERLNRLTAILTFTDLLVCAANNDVGEGRSDDAIEKYRCIVQLGRHVCQQPFFVERGEGAGIEERGLGRLIELIAQVTLSAKQLAVIEKLPIQTKNDWSETSDEMLRVERVLYRRKYSTIARLKDFVAGSTLKGFFKSRHDTYLGTISCRRALKITIALARYRNAHGSWPKHLDQIKELVPGEVLIDPVNGSSFVYRMSGNTFMLYSRGKNGVDEDGRYTARSDPNSLEIIVEHDDRQFWPPTVLQE